MPHATCNVDEEPPTYSCSAKKSWRWVEEGAHHFDVYVPHVTVLLLMTKLMFHGNT